MSKGNVPAWVRDDLARGRKAALRSASPLDVFDAESASGLDLRHDPGELRYSGAPGRVLAVNGAPL